MKTVRQVLDDKGHEVWTIGPDESVYSALQAMADKEVGALVVTEGERIVGLLSERDYARKVILKGKSSKEIKVREIMSAPVICAHFDESVDECMAVVTETRVRHLPVEQDGKLVGLVSIGDLVKAIIAEQQFVIEQLEGYISG